ncbi:hypothetical protein [Herbidospora solisilvae]|uniref:hypothetical protein n=1 Tax=Herbidospora solisilvae TaxID=2696284 RepID=UPI0019298C26|nr:hypothetical protein [Herbidospora solisilvae]
MLQGQPEDGADHPGRQPAREVGDQLDLVAFGQFVEQFGGDGLRDGAPRLDSPGGEGLHREFAQARVSRPVPPVHKARRSLERPGTKWTGHGRR